ncbi:MAG TPA: MaoC family dehydratase [Gammaproteobacteria bacterium]|nr:MaoC family dehydratase [Gammaproteobacteria bacterium]
MAEQQAAARESFSSIQVGQSIQGQPFSVSRESIQRFADGSLDYNPLHFDDEYMKNEFGKTRFGGVIMHGMQNFALITRTLTDWLLPQGGYHRRLETRWRKPVYPGDVITTHATVSDKFETEKSRWVTFDIEVKNQKGQAVATGQSMAEFPDKFPGRVGSPT